MSGVQISLGIAGRSLRLIPRVPSTFVPALVMPIFLTVAYSGALSGLVLLPGFPADKSIDWFLPMATMMGCSFAGIATGVAVARDLENGFYDRLLASPASRLSLLAGPVLASMCRALIPLTLMVTVAVLGGAHFYGGILGVVTLVVAGVGLAAVAGTWALGVALRLKTQQATPLMFLPVFLSVFLSTAQMPLELLGGWIHSVARVNPMTNVLALARQGFLGDVTWAGTWPGLVAIAAVGALLSIFTGRSMQKVTR